jgi:hypothetical protein
MGFELGVFHVELKNTSRGARLIEVNARMGGGPVRNTNLLVWGVDLVEQHVTACCGIPCKPAVAQKPLKELAELTLNAKVCMSPEQNVATKTLETAHIRTALVHMYVDMSLTSQLHHVTRTCCVCISWVHRGTGQGHRSSMATGCHVPERWAWCLVRALTAQECACR